MHREKLGEDILKQARVTDQKRENSDDISEQAYDKIFQRVTNGNSGIVFLDAPGDTGKTFLINLV